MDQGNEIHLDGKAVRKCHVRVTAIYLPYLIILIYIYILIIVDIRIY